MSVPKESQAQREARLRSPGFWVGKSPEQLAREGQRGQIKIVPENFDPILLERYLIGILGKNYPEQDRKIAEKTAHQIIQDLSPRGSTHPSVNQTPTAPEEIQPRLF